MKWLFSWIVLFSMVNVEADLFHRQSPIEEEWVEEELSPFDECIVSWNADRPIQGLFLFYVSVKVDDTWSPWLPYASWGNTGQYGCASAKDSFPVVKVYQDIVELLESKQATGFRIRVIAEKGACLENIHRLHVYTNSNHKKGLSPFSSSLTSVGLGVKGLSQMTLHHSRYEDLCSPTSVTAVIRYLLNDETIDPIDIAEQVKDGRFDIYGNWVFNIATASSHLGARWSCWVERFNNFDDIYHRLSKGTPVIVSIRGLALSRMKPDSTGHLLAVIGYDASHQKVLCMDPSFPLDSETIVSYDVTDFLRAWMQRGNIAYVFSRDT